VARHTALVCSQPTRPAQFGQSSVGKEYWRWFPPPKGQKQQVLCNSRTCYQDCWHTDRQSYAGL